MPLGHPVFTLPSEHDARIGALAVLPALAAPPGWSLLLTPDFDDWQPGDIVLVEKRGLKGAFIALGQGALLPHVNPSTPWSHCAIYIGGGHIVDAMPGKHVGVRKRLLDDYTKKRATALLRLAIDDVQIDAALGQLVADQAIGMLPFRYSIIGNLLRLARSFILKKAGIGAGMQPVPKEIRKVYCSSLVVVAYRRALNISLDSDVNVLPCMPANLPAHSDLYSQVTDWHEVL